MPTSSPGSIFFSSVSCSAIVGAAFFFNIEPWEAMQGRNSVLLSLTQIRGCVRTALHPLSIVCFRRHSLRVVPSYLRGEGYRKISTYSDVSILKIIRQKQDFGDPRCAK